MFSYYGSKANVIDSYPPPKFGKVIEPFAGSARYALKYFDRDVLLVDKYEVIVKIWKWLQLCSKKDILNLPRFVKDGQTLSDYSFDCEEAKMLFGFIWGPGSQSPANKVKSRKVNYRPNYINYSLIKIAADLFKIKHWEIRLGSYDQIQNEDATWFIDPPYQFGGSAYVHSNKKIDFTNLSKWSRERQGQVIVCENTKADWMDFKPMKKQKGSLFITTEAIWSNCVTNYDNQQSELFTV